MKLENVFSTSGLINCDVPFHKHLSLRPFLLICINDLPQALNETGSYLYADDTCIFYQDKNVEKIEVLNKEFSSLCEWFIDNKLSIHFGNYKTKINFPSQMKSPPKLSISYGECTLRQHNTVEYLGCYLYFNHNRELMARRGLKKIDIKINFLWRQSNYLNYSSRRLLCNAHIQPHFDYGCTSWYPLLSKTLKTKLQIAQNKCIHFCLELPPHGHTNPFQENKPVSG